MTDDTKIPPGYSERADKYLTAAEWRALLAAHPVRNPATRALLESGHASFTVDGVRYGGPAVGPAPDKATHHVGARVDSLTDEKGHTTWIN